MEKGKVVIISGNKRAGKTTLAMKLHKEGGFNFYNFDTIADSFEEVHPNLEGDEYYVKFLEQMVGYALNFAEQYSVNSVFEYIDFDPSLLYNFKYKDSVEIYYLANLEANIDNVKEDMLKYSKPFDWPLTCSEEDMNRNIGFILNKNNRLIEECNKYGFTLINTKRGEDREKVLSELSETIINSSLDNKITFN